MRRIAPTNLRRRQPQSDSPNRMIDNFALGLTHLLMMIAAWRLLRRADLDREDGAPPGRWR